MLTVKNMNIDSNFNCSLSSSPLSPLSSSSVTSNEENSYQHTMGFGVNNVKQSNSSLVMMGDGLTSFTGTISGNGTNSNSGSVISTSGVKRKREKLDHLTEEEKLMRRKLKNRISAQTARDRKKEKLTELECKLNQVSKTNCLLVKENTELKKKLTTGLDDLRQQNEQLEAENKLLKERLTVLENKINCTGDFNVITTTSPTVQQTNRNISSNSNLQIKMDSNGESLVTEKSKVNSVESAEEPGVSQRDFSDFDQAISSIIDFDGEECEEIIKWLHRCSEQLLDQNIDQLSDDSGIEDGGSHSDETALRLSPTSEEPKKRDLESIRDLITFDHMYHRNDTLVQSQINDEMTVMTTSTTATESILPPLNCEQKSSDTSSSPASSSLESPSLFNSDINNNLMPQPNNDLLVNKPLNFVSTIDSNIFSTETDLYESNLNLFDDLFPELI